jgi:hypothetical protein
VAKVRSKVVISAAVLTNVINVVLVARANPSITADTIAQVIVL